MAKIKIYNKRGNLSKEEKKHVRALEKFFKENPEKAENFVPAKNAKELQKLYSEHTVTDVEFEETQPEVNEQTERELDEFLNKQDAEETTTGEETHESFRNKMQEDMEAADVSESEVIDPFNRDNPIIRDYVGQPSAPGQQTIQGSPGATFAEPGSFKDSFEIPETVEEKLSEDGKVEEPGKPGTGPQQPRPKYQAPEPMNPAWDDMAKNKKRTSTRRFAKYIVEATCMLSERGFVWFATKDITEAKVAEYELKDEFDLSLMLTVLDERNMEQQVTIKQFFKIQCVKAELLSKIPDDEKKDLIDALTEVLLEKGVGPTPTQELLLISLKIFGGQAMTLFAITSQTNSVLSQLRAMKEGYSDDRDVQEAARSEAVKEEVAAKQEYNETTEAVKKATSKAKARSRGKGGKSKEGDFSLDADQDSKHTKE